MNIHQLIAQSKQNTDLITVEATVITGFEFLAQDECREKCKPMSLIKSKGRVFLNISSSDFNKVLSLRSVDNIFLVAQTFENIPFQGKKDCDLQIIKSLVDKIDWDDILNQWIGITSFQGIVYPNLNKKLEMENESVNSSMSMGEKQVCHKNFLIENSNFHKIEETENIVQLQENPNAITVKQMNTPSNSSTKLNVEVELGNLTEEDKERVSPDLILPNALETIKRNPNQAEGKDDKTPNTGNHAKNRAKNKHFEYKKSGKRRGQEFVERQKTSKAGDVLRFRATCNRVGEKHSFNSMEAACEFGGTLQDKFGWTVDLTQFDLNVVLNIENRQGYVCIAITHESLHRRNITHFNNTTLRATMCYNLLRLSEPMTGEIVIDPLCGGGSIPIEGALSFPKTFHICGDYNEKAMERTRANIGHLHNNKEQLNIGAIAWNVKYLPLRDQSIDILITDLPFGKRSGSKQDNKKLYNNVLLELARVVRIKTGRACLMTYDKTSFIRALRIQNNYWREIKQFGVNQGGLFSSVFLLLRKATEFDVNTELEENKRCLDSYETVIGNNSTTQEQINI